MTYAVKEIFYTLQGEGAQAGRAAVFCRFAGCNLWSGREADRATALCRFCDTEFVGVDGEGGGRFSSAEALAQVRNPTHPHADITFLMNPCRVSQVRDIAFAGEVMPQKSTDFYPKLLSGLTIYALD